MLNNLTNSISMITNSSAPNYIDLALMNTAVNLVINTIASVRDGLIPDNVYHDLYLKNLN